MRRALRGVSGLVIVLVGCSLSAPQVRYFEIRPTAAAKKEGAQLPSILVPDFSCIAAYDHLRLVIRKSPVEVVSSRNLQWTTTPGRMLAQGLRSRLEATGRFETVRREANPRPPYVIEALVQTIELSTEQAATARLALHLNVRRSADGSVIGEEFVDESRTVTGRDQADGILALRDLYSQILDGVSDNIIAVIERDLQRPAAHAER
ncbi:MAG: membrane integrity-associated transporter subunit PqiC [Deltaproteobacteria bacterium]|nr:membrane integrity-associated transporter subunit PqiC [Deltaproteobacteria bacterium]MBI3388938.1 membrane integrity-associated transporter subunit PqiC [Deltaproteobacteria bacterium]